MMKMPLPCERDVGFMIHMAWQHSNNNNETSRSSEENMLAAPYIGVSAEFFHKEGVVSRKEVRHGYKLLHRRSILRNVLQHSVHPTATK
jgi:hypothetical protein